MAKKQAASSEAEPEATTPTDFGPDADDGVALQDRLQQLQFAAAESYDKLSEAAAQLTEQARGVYETSQDSVRRNPVSYVLGAFALGCVLGVLLGRD